MVIHFCWLNRIVLEALRFWLGIRIEYRFIDWTAAWPETATAYFVRIGFHIDKTGHIRCAGVHRRSTPRKARDSQIESSPKKMYRADLSYETGTKFP